MPGCKGLGVPVVAGPRLWRAPAAPKAGGRRPVRPWLPPGSSEPHLDLHLNPHWGQGRAAAKQDRDAQLQEAERLAYVACTRARHLLVLGWPGPQAAESGNPLEAWLEGRDGLPLHAIAPDSLPPAERTWQPQPSSRRPEVGTGTSRNLEPPGDRPLQSGWAHTHAAPGTPNHALGSQNQAPPHNDERTREHLRELAKQYPPDPRSELWTKV